MRSSRIWAPTAEPALPVTSRRTAGGISAKDVAERFERSAGTDPIFRLVDGATCPSHDISTVRAKKTRLQTADGERPASRRACGSNDGGIRHHGHPRPLWLQHQSGNRLGHSIDVPAPPVTNVSFLSTVMWDGRENTGKGLAADLKSQARDATLGHAQGRCIANRRPAG
jgi:cytochrome c peroxidase